MSYPPFQELISNELAGECSKGDQQEKDYEDKKPSRNLQPSGSKGEERQHIARFDTAHNFNSFMYFAAATTQFATSETSEPQWQHRR